MSADAGGEEWARAELRVLRDASWAPRAWARLVRESHRRARVTRRCEPDLARGADALALALSGVVTGASLPGGSRRTLVAMAWSAGCWAMLRWHLGMARRPGAAALGAGDALTAARVWAAPLLASAPRRHLPSLLGLAAVTDALDGPLARRRGGTRLGRDLDSAADTAVLFAIAARRDLLPAAVRGALAARAAIPAALATHAYLAAAERPPWADTGATRRAAAPTLLGLGLAAGGRRRAGATITVAGATLALLPHAAAGTGPSRQGAARTAPSSRRKRQRA